MAERRTVRLVSALVLIVGVFAAIVTWVDRLGASTNAGTVAYYALPLGVIAGGAWGVAGRSARVRVAALLAGVLALAAWFMVLHSQSDINGLWSSRALYPTLI